MKRSSVMTPSVPPLLTELQMEMLKPFAAKVPAEDLIQIRNLIARYLLEKARDEADAIRDEKGYSDEKLKGNKDDAD